MEKYEIRGLDLEELEAQRVELLPERVEMRRRNRRGRGNQLRCNNAAVNLLAIPIGSGIQVCFFQR
jgi:ribosomal protein L29